jgi:uncharacterized protein YacL
MAQLTRVPSVVLETLRLLVVVCGAAAGYELANRLGALPGDTTVGSLSGLWLGAILGAMLGYVLGGAIARLTLRSMARGERALDGMQPEQLVSGSLGAIIAAGLTAMLCWPIFLVANPLIAVPIFSFFTITACLFGFRVGRTRREAVLGAVGGRSGLATRAVAVAALPRIIDTSVAIDGRILEVVRAGFLHGRFLVVQPVLDELQAMADSADDLARAKGRRGLDILESLRQESTVELIPIGDEAPAVTEVDAKLVRMSIDRAAALLTLDTNLAKAASLAGVRVLNLHALGLAMRPLVVVGDDVDVHLIKAGKEAGQGVGYLEDGTMVVTEQSRDRLGEDVRVTVTSVLTTANGRMVFARPAGVAAGGRR